MDVLSNYLISMIIKSLILTEYYPSDANYTCALIFKHHSVELKTCENVNSSCRIENFSSSVLP